MAFRLNGLEKKEKTRPDYIHDEPFHFIITVVHLCTAFFQK